MKSGFFVIKSKKGDYLSGFHPETKKPVYSSQRDDSYWSRDKTRLERLMQQNSISDAEVAEDNGESPRRRAPL